MVVLQKGVPGAGQGDGILTMSSSIHAGRVQTADPMHSARELSGLVFGPVATMGESNWEDGECHGIGRMILSLI